MKSKHFTVFIILCLLSFSVYSQDTNTTNNESTIPSIYYYDMIQNNVFSVQTRLSIEKETEIKDLFNKHFDIDKKLFDYFCHLTATDLNFRTALNLTNLSNEKDRLDVIRREDQIIGMMGYYVGKIPGQDAEIALVKKMLNCILILKQYNEKFHTTVFDIPLLDGKPFDYYLKYRE